MWFDFDDLIVEYVETLMEYLAEVEGINLTMDSWHKYSLVAAAATVDQKLTIEDVKHILARFQKSEYYHRIKPTPGAVETITRLSQNWQSLEMFINTARQDVVAHLTLIWTQQFFPENTFAGFCFVNKMALNGAGQRKRNKEDFTQSLKVDLIVEDAYDNIEACRQFISGRASTKERVVKAILLTRRWNQHIQDQDLAEGVVRANDWAEVEQILAEIYDCFFRQY
jgi:hypothetical protein